MTRTAAYWIIAAATALPRLVALVVDRGDLFGDFTEKSAHFALTYVESGTFGFIPGQPSAYTQPLYAFFLTPLYAAFGESWAAVGLAQIAVAVATAWLVFEIGRRVLSAQAGLVAALLTTLHPYLIWHDVHVNREILDHLLAAAAVLATLLAAERLTPARVGTLGVVVGLSILANVRLAALPVILLAYVAWKRGLDRRFALSVGAVALIAVVLVAPWVVRNGVVVGCWAVTTDSRALWKANNENTYRVLTDGGWIDDVPSIPGTEPSPQTAGKLYRETGRVLDVDECAQMRFYQDEVVDFWRDHPGEKARLAVLATRMQWSPAVTLAPNRPGLGTWLDVARKWSEPLFATVLYALALLGAPRLPRPFLALTAALLAYQTVLAMVFVGSTRYRVPWDFLLALPAAAALLWLVQLWSRRRATAPGAPPPATGNRE